MGHIGVVDVNGIGGLDEFGKTRIAIGHGLSLPHVKRPHIGIGGSDGRLDTRLGKFRSRIERASLLQREPRSTRGERGDERQTNQQSGKRTPKELPPSPNLSTPCRGFFCDLTGMHGTSEIEFDEVATEMSVSLSESFFGVLAAPTSRPNVMRSQFATSFFDQVDHFAIFGDERQR